MKELKKILGDKTTNRTIVAIIIGYGTASFIFSLVQTWNTGPLDYWRGQVVRLVLAFVIMLIVAEVVASQSK